MPDADPYMPKLGTSKLQELAEWITSVLSDLDMDSIKQDVAAAWDEFNLEPTADNIFPGCSNVRSPVARMAVQHKATLFDQGILRQAQAYRIIPQQEAVTDAPQASDKTILQQGYWKWVFESKLGLTQFFRTQTVPLCVQGWIPIRVRRHQKIEYRPVPSKSGMEIAAGIVQEMADVRPVWYKNFRCDSSAGTIQESPYVGEAIVVPAAELLHLADTRPGYVKDAVKEAVQYEAAASGGGDAGGQRAGEQEIDISVPDIEWKNNPPVQVEAWYAEVPGEVAGNDGPVRYYGWFHQATGRVLYVNYLVSLDPQNLYPYEVPVLIPSWDKQGGKWWGYGIPAFNRQISEVVTSSMNRVRNDALKAANPPIAYKGDDRYLRTYTPMWMMNAMWPTEDPRNVTFVQVPLQNHSLQLEEYGMFGQLYRQMTATYEAAQGDVDALKSHTAATSVSQILGASTRPHAMDAMRIAEQFQAVLRRAAAIERTILEDSPADQQIMFHVAGEDGAGAVMGATPADLLGEFLFEFDVSGLESQERAQNLLQAVQTISSSPIIQLFPERINGLLVEVLKLLGVPYQQFQVTEEETKTRQAEIQAEALAKAIGQQEPEKLAQAIASLPPQYLLQLPREVIGMMLNRIAMLSGSQGGGV